MGLLKHLCMTGQCQPHQRAPSPRRRPPELDTLRTGPMPSPQRSADKYQVARSGQLRSNSRMLTSLQSREGVDAMLELDRLYRSRCRPVLWHIQSPSGRAQELEKRSQAYQIDAVCTITPVTHSKAGAQRSDLSPPKKTAGLKQEEALEVPRTPADLQEVQPMNMSQAKSLAHQQPRGLASILTDARISSIQQEELPTESEILRVQAPASSGVTCAAPEEACCSSPPEDWVVTAAVVAVSTAFTPLHLNILAAQRLEEWSCKTLASVVGDRIVPTRGFGAGETALRAVKTAERVSAKSAGAALGLCSSLACFLRQ